MMRTKSFILKAFSVAAAMATAALTGTVVMADSEAPCADMPQEYREHWFASASVDYQMEHDPSEILNIAFPAPTDQSAPETNERTRPPATHFSLRHSTASSRETTWDPTTTATWLYYLSIVVARWYEVPSAQFEHISPQEKMIVPETSKAHLDQRQAQQAQEETIAPEGKLPAPNKVPVPMGRGKKFYYTRPHRAMPKRVAPNPRPAILAPNSVSP